VRSKVRCCLDPGGCSRCASRGILCTYQGTLNGQSVANLVAEADSGSFMPTRPSELADISPVDIPPQSSDDFRPCLDSPSVVTEETSGSSNLSLTTFTWENDSLRPEWSFVSDLPTDLGESYALGSHVDASSIDGELQSAFNTVTLPGQSRQASSSIPVSLAYRDPSLLFERRKFSEPELELTGDLALHILRSYPYMIANRDSVPPFIHPKYQHLSKSETARPNSLDAALKLAKMVLHGRRINKNLIWGLIRTEQERILNEVRTRTPNPC